MTLLVRIFDPATAVVSYWADTRDSLGRLTASEPFATLNEAVAYVALKNAWDAGTADELREAAQSRSDDERLTQSV
jgi:hypothetical protein